MNHELSIFKSIRLFHLYSLGRQMAQAHFGEFHLLNKAAAVHHHTPSVWRWSFWAYVESAQLRIADNVGIRMRLLWINWSRDFPPSAVEGDVGSASIKTALGMTNLPAVVTAVLACRPPSRHSFLVSLLLCTSVCVCLCVAPQLTSENAACLPACLPPHSLTFTVWRIDTKSDGRRAKQPQMARTCPREERTQYKLDKPTQL